MVYRRSRAPKKDREEGTEEGRNDLEGVRASARVKVLKGIVSWSKVVRRKHQVQDAGVGSTGWSNQRSDRLTRELDDDALGRCGGRLETRQYLYSFD